MHVATSDLSRSGGSTPFTFRGIAGTPIPREAQPADHTQTTGSQRVAPRVDASTSTQAADARRLNLVRSVVEQIVGRTLDAADIDAIVGQPQPVALAFNHVRSVKATERMREAREQAATAPARPPVGSAVSWGASLDLEERSAGTGNFAMSGSLQAAGGREVAVEVRLMGEGEDAVVPVRLDIELDSEAKPVRMSFTGRAVTDDGTPGTGEPARAAAWAGLPVRVQSHTGDLQVTTITDARAAGGIGAGGGHVVDMVA